MYCNLYRRRSLARYILLVGWVLPKRSMMYIAFGNDIFKWEYSVGFSAFKERESEGGGGEKSVNDVERVRACNRVLHGKCTARS